MVIPRKPVPDPDQLTTGPLIVKDSSSEIDEPAATALSEFGKPANKPLINVVDSIAVLLSLLCLGLAIAAVSISHYAAELQYTKQIIVIGLLLGIMNQCLLRLLPQMFLLLEAKFGRGTLQNYDGILRWSPYANRLGIVWRVLLVLLLLLPLALGVLYKRFTGGVARLTQHSVGINFSPNAPPGLENVGGLSIMVNTTIPFMAASSDDVPLPDFSTGAEAYGYNILLVSNNSAAALDGPVGHQVSHLQAELDPDSRYYLSADVRATLVQYNEEAKAHRTDRAWWDAYFTELGCEVCQDMAPGILAVLPWTGNDFGMLNVQSAKDDTPFWWNVSWVFLSAFPMQNGETNDTKLVLSRFRQEAHGFNAKRHACRGTWMVTKSSIQLLSGHCDPQPLPQKYQYLENCQMGLVDTYLPLLTEFLGPFGTYRKDSHWKVPSFAVATASMYTSRIASANGVVDIQPRGWLYSMDGMFNTADGVYNETYFVDEGVLSFEVPTLRVEAGLYFVLAVQPVLTVIAFLVTIVLYGVPINRGFGMVSVLAGVEKESLALLRGAAFSGTVDRDIGMKVCLQTWERAVDTGKVSYTLGASGCNGKVKRKYRYA